ncbi:hypothetical protein NQ317_008975 [Molorchus minor]|uniref:SUN domain-containing protein n=1 Tax=Molorchus minor TaxID=1323400 RepID=A0ABQ9JBU3_9CUCU|nr:hypothetical protein NQ317_008975 [Molorchus minor]
MLLDTWLLLKRGDSKKSSKLVALCLIPLLLLGGWWMLSSLGTAIYGAYFNSTEIDTPLLTKSEESQLTAPDIKYLGKVPELNINQPVEEKIVKITEKIYMEPPSASEIAGSLSSEQLEAISKSVKHSVDINEHFNTETIVQQIMESPNFQMVFNKYNNYQISKEESDNNADLLYNQQNIIEGLRDEINKIKKDMLDIEKSRNEDFAKMLLEFKAENKGLTDYLHSVFLAKQDLEQHLANLTHSFNSKFDELMDESTQRIMNDISRKITIELNEKIKHIETDINSSKYRGDIALTSISDERIKEIVKGALQVYDADKTGLVDYAMETMGGQILTTRCTENYHYGKAVVSVLGIPLWYPVNSPRTIITPSINPGECWAFQNFPGFVVIRLSNRVQVEAFSMEHISKLLVPNGKIDSAPKDFEVYGLSSEDEREPVKLGEYVYDYDGEPLQFFSVQNEGHPNE